MLAGQATASSRSSPARRCSSHPTSALALGVLTEALRALTAGGPAVGPVPKSVAWIVGLTLVFAPLAIHRYRRLA